MSIDSVFVIVSIILGLSFIGRLAGVREGTILAALFVGTIANYFHKNITFVDKLLPVKKQLNT